MKDNSKYTGGRMRKYRRLSDSSANYDDHKKYKTTRGLERENKRKLKANAHCYEHDAGGNERTKDERVNGGEERSVEGIKKKKFEWGTMSVTPKETPSDTLIGGAGGSSTPDKNLGGRPFIPSNVTIEDEQQQLFEAYVKHLASGKASKTFTWRGFHFKGTYLAAEGLIKHFPDRFKKIDIDIAKAIGYGTWEQVVADSAVGINTKANTATLQMIMRNKYDWDKQGSVNSEFIEAEINRLTTFFAAIGLTQANREASVLSEGQSKKLEHDGLDPVVVRSDG